MDNDKLSNFIEGIKDTIRGTVLPGPWPARWAGYAEGVDAARDVDFDPAEGVDAARDVDFDPADYDAEDLFARYFG